MRDDVKLYALSNETYFEEIVHWLKIIDYCQPRFQIGTLCSEIEGCKGKLSDNKMIGMGIRNI